MKLTTLLSYSACLLLVGCLGSSDYLLIHDKTTDYQTAKATQKLHIPTRLSKAKLKDSYPVPNGPLMRKKPSLVPPNSKARTILSKKAVSKKTVSKAKSPAKLAKTLKKKPISLKSEASQKQSAALGNKVDPKKAKHTKKASKRPLAKTKTEPKIHSGKVTQAHAALTRLVAKRLASITSDANGNIVLVMNRAYSKAWTMLGKALPKAGYEIVSQDQKLGLFAITTGKGVNAPLLQLTVNPGAQANKTLVTIYTAEGKSHKTGMSKTLLKKIFKEIS